MGAVLEMGFDEARDWGEGLKTYRAAVSHYLSSEDKPVPAIASACPTVVQLVQVKYPSLLENLVPVIPPWEIAARLWPQTGVGNSDPHLYYITPCLARAQATSDPLSSGIRYEGAIPFAALYNPLKSLLSKKSSGPVSSSASGEPTLAGMNWATAGGQSQALKIAASLIVEGMDGLANILELAENGLLADVPFIEAWACPAGCLGGSLTIQDPFLARYHLMAFSQKGGGWTPEGDGEAPDVKSFRQKGTLKSRPGLRLDPDLKRAMKKLHRIDEILKRLPGIDCGSCGCPSCLAFAEDIVQGYAGEEDCFYASRENLSKDQWQGRENPNKKGGKFRGKVPAPLKR
jgi:hypothetical protein